MLKTDEKIKQKMLGVLMRSVRNRVGLTLDETAGLLGIQPAELADYELGRREADLPLLEALAGLANMPVSYFWSENPLPAPDTDYSFSKAVQLRRKIVGVLLNKARLDAGKSPEDIAGVLNCPPEQVHNVELGRAELPFSRLQVVAPYLNVSLDYFSDGVAAAEQEVAPKPNGSAPVPPVPPAPPVPAVPSAPPVSEEEYLGHFSPEVQDFLKNPANQLYIKLAMRLHGLSSSTLRTLAEGILDITY